MRDENKTKEKSIPDGSEALAERQGGRVSSGKPSLKPRTIRRILLVVLLAALVPGMFVQALLHLQRFNTEQAREMQTHVDVARAVAVAFQASIEDMAQEVYAVGLAILRLLPEDHDAASRFFSAAIQRLPAAVELAWLSEEGRVIAASDRSAVGQDRHSEEYLTGLGSDRSWVLGPVQPDRQTGAATFTIACFLEDVEGRTRGVLTASMDAERFADTRLKIHRTPDAGFILMDYKGIVAFRRPYFPFPQWQRRDFSMEELASAALAGREASGILFLAMTGKRWFTARTPVPGLGWVAGAGREYDTVMAPLWRDLGLSVGLSVLCLLVSGSIALYYGRMILTDLHELHTSVTTWSKSQKPVTQTTGGNIAELQNIGSAFETVTRQRVEAERALRESEDRFRKIFENAATGIVITNWNGHFQQCNPSFCVLLGYTEEEFRRIEFASIIHPEDQVTNLTQIRRLQAGELQFFQIENRYVRKDGQPVWVHKFVSVLPDAMGKPAHLVALVTDITERKRAEEALEWARNTLEEAQKIAHLGSFEYVAATRTTVWSEEEYRIYGLDPAGPSPAYEVMLAKCIHPDDAALLHETFTKAMQSGSIYELEHRIVRPDNSVRWVYDRAQPYFDENRNLLRYVGTTLDITERKRVEDAIEKSERRFRALTEKAGELITVLDATGIITYNLAGDNSTLGYTAEELVGRNAFDLVHPDDLPRMANLFQEGVPKMEKVEHAEFRVRAKDGSWRWQFAVGTNLLYEPDVGGILINSRDITERKQAEESLRESESFYRQTLESIPGMVFTTRPDGYCDYQSQQWVDYTGIPLSEHLGDGWNQLLHPDDRSRAFEAWRSAVEGLALYDLEYRVRRHDGAYEWFRVIGRPIRDTSGEIVRWFGVAMNIEDLKQVERALRQLNETLEQRVAQRTELAEGRAKQLQALSMELIEVEEQERQRIAELLHDDLQQVLAAARMQLQAACETIPPEPMLEGVEQLLVESIRKMRRLSHELSPAVLHHSGLVAAMQWLARNMEDQFGLQVQLESDGAHELESSPLRVFLFRAVQELLFNVVKHAGVKNAQVALSRSGSSLAMTVSDQGQGFSPDILDSYTETRGFGLLSIRERARYTGGSLVIESAPGQGSRLTLTVPISIPIDDELKQSAAGRQPLTQAGFPVSTGISGLRVLFVDDHSVMRQGLIRLMTGQPNIQVVGEAANGREAIERVRQLKPDVVVMDVSMPEMDGIEATRRIKAEFPTVRVIGLSMYEEEQFANSMRQAGAEAFVNKTASPAELLEAIYGFDH